MHQSPWYALEVIHNKAKRLNMICNAELEYAKILIWTRMMTEITKS